jgi:hypothetical protein
VLLWQDELKRIQATAISVMAARIEIRERLNLLVADIRGLALKSIRFLP